MEHVAGDHTHHLSIPLGNIECNGKSMVFMTLVNKYWA